MKFSVCLTVAVFLLMSAPGWGSVPTPQFSMEQDRLRVSHGESSLDISLKSPKFFFRDIDDWLGGMAPVNSTGDLPDGDLVTLNYPPLPIGKGAALEVQMSLQWNPEEAVLRKWVVLNLTESEEEIVLNEIVLDTLDAGNILHGPGLPPPRSSPVFFSGFFAGIEFPVASTRLEGNELFLAHHPLFTLKKGEPYRSRCAVYGLAPQGGESDAFREYIERHRPAPKGLHINYNSWWTSPVPFTEKDILDLMCVFEKELYQAHGVALDSFTIDMGWSNPESIWEIAPSLFPEGFSRIQAAAERMGAHLGLWTSPSSFYSPALDPEWAAGQGYDVFQFSVPWSPSGVRLLSLGDERYSTRFRERLVDMVSRFGIRQIKLDGYYLGENYMAGPHSSEKTAEGGIAAFEEVRKAAPDTWLECTFDANASPWWLFYVNSVIGGFGDDSPHGRVPCPIYRESYTTARDYYNLESFSRLSSPVAAREILGILHQSDDPFMNDAVMTIMRGHAFLPLYVNPKFMNKERWSLLAKTLCWARGNEDRITGSLTVPLYPREWVDAPDAPRTAMSRMPYGYAHWARSGGLAVLRNPWIASQEYDLLLPEALVFTEGTPGFDVISLYPEPRLYGSAKRPGETVKILLAPYETVVLDIAVSAGHEIVLPGSEMNNRIAVESSIWNTTQVEYEGETHAPGPDWTDTTGFEKGMFEIELAAGIRVDAPQARLLVLAEGSAEAPSVQGDLSINDIPVVMKVIRSGQGFSASSTKPEEYWTFLEASLPEKYSKLNLTVRTGQQIKDCSAWVWAGKAGEKENEYPNSLPPPEWISLSGAALLAPGDYAKGLKQERRERTISQIDGIFLDAMEPVSERQGWGTLQRNQSIWERPITLDGKQFQRGLGVHAVSEVVYALDKKYTIFEALAGVDSANNGTITFAVFVDGVKQWESGLMAREIAPKPVRVNIAGASELRLVVGDGENGIIGDHADWAEARLLR